MGDDSLWIFAEGPRDIDGLEISEDGLKDKIDRHDETRDIAFYNDLAKVSYTPNPYS